MFFREIPFVASSQAMATRVLQEDPRPHALLSPPQPYSKTNTVRTAHPPKSDGTREKLTGGIALWHSRRLLSVATVQMNEEEDEPQAPRPSVARAESSRPRPGQGQPVDGPQAGAHGREGGSLGGMMRWWKQDRGSFGAGRRKSGGGIAVSGGVTVV